MNVVAVHTTGVNWQGVLAVVASMVVILGFFSGVIIYMMKSAIRTEIHGVISVDVTPTLNLIQDELRQHDTRIARLEGVEEGKRQAVLAAGVTKKT